MKFDVDSHTIFLGLTGSAPLAPDPTSTCAAVASSPRFETSSLPREVDEVASDELLFEPLICAPNVAR